jgi:protease-4
MLNPDSLVERSKLRSQVSIWRTVFFIALILFVLITFASKSNIEGMKENKPFVARVNLTDIIFEDQDRLDILKELGEDKEVKAVIMHINSPGGTAVGGEVMYNALKDLNAKKPVVVVMNSLAASAAYLTALGAERVYAQNGTITGSIGVIMEIPNVKALADKIGLKFDYVRTSPIKGSPTLFEDKNEKALATLDSAMQDFYKYFVSVVAEERNLSPEKALALSDGRIFSGKAAVDNNLVDAIGNENDAFKWLVANKKISNDLKIEEVKLYKPKKPFEEFLGSLSENFGLKALTDRIFNFKGLLL